jgi:transcriptional regulator with XRE-family HTH domain
MNDETPGHLWAVVEEWRDSIRWPPSQRTIAKTINVSSSAFTDWKYGRGFPEPDSLHALAELMQVPYERVLDAVLKDRGYREVDDSRARPRRAGLRTVQTAARKTGKPTAQQRREAEPEDDDFEPR